MDSDTICFQNLNLRQKLFQEQLDDLIRMRNERTSNIVLNAGPLNKKESYFENVKELSKESNRQRTEESAILKEHNECSKQIADINQTIEAMKHTLEKLINEASLGKEELKQIKKPLMKAIKKYSTNFNIYVDVKKHDTDIFLGTVKFSSKKDAKSVEFLIDRQTKRILDFNTDSLLTKEETQELKNKALTENGLNIELILSKLRHLASNAII